MRNELKYGRLFLFSLLLLSYMQGAFQQSLMEAIHVIVHIQDGIRGEFHHHTFQSHSKDHQHIGLEKIKVSQEDQNKSTQQEIKSNKKIEIIEIVTKSFKILPKEVNPNFIYCFSYQDPLLQIAVPPPILV